MTPKEFFEMLAESIDWRQHRTFWDEHNHGPKPPHYFVWRFSNREFIETDDDVDVEKKTFRASFFTKKEDEQDSVREQAEALGLANGLTVKSDVYEEHEADTHYNRFDIDFTFYKED